MVVAVIVEDWYHCTIMRKVWFVFTPIARVSIKIDGNGEVAVYKENLLPMSKLFFQIGSKAILENRNASE